MMGKEEDLVGGIPLKDGVETNPAICANTDKNNRDWKGKKMNRAVFLDRDGVVNELRYHPDLKIKCAPFTASKFKMINGVPEAINLIHRFGYLCILISNQPDIGLGMMTVEDFEEIKLKMKTELAKAGAYMDGEYYCMHHPAAMIEEYKSNCDCRKPKPGLLLRASGEHNIDMANSWFIGDYLTDVAAGKNADCHTILISKRKPEIHDSAGEDDVKPDIICSDLTEAVQYILKAGE